jgi:hypothetical protein
VGEVVGAVEEVLSQLAKNADKGAIHERIDLVEEDDKRPWANL